MKNKGEHRWRVVIMQLRHASKVLMKEKKNIKEWLSLGLLLFSILATLVTTGIRYDDVYLPFADMKDVQVI